MSSQLAGVKGGLNLGLDLGTSGLKAVALDGRGEVVARAGASYPDEQAGTGAAEQHPACWISAVEPGLVLAEREQLGDGRPVPCRAVG
jgi:sugar (pentulose or hexulose) kinase